MFNRVGFTGTREGMTGEQKKTVLHLVEELLDSHELHHGDCVGADKNFHDMFEGTGRDIYIHPPTNESKRAFCQGAIKVYEAQDYLVRNHAIVDNSDYLIATPNTKNEELRSGTWSTIRYARQQGKPVYVVFTDGSLDTKEE